MNKYEKLGVIGEGTFGVVLKCRHKETDEVVAIKKFKEEAEEDEASKKITLREVKLLRALKHENVVELKEAFRRKGVLYLVFEHMEQSVMDLLEAKPNGVGKDTVEKLTYQLLRALEHCHRHNVIHRDIKPENLLVNTSDNALRLCDFGCARQMKANVPLTDYVATRWYRPPELLLSTTDYGKGVDMWGLGCIMGELTDGQPLFAGKSDIDQLFVIQRILGPLTSQQSERCLELSNFKGIQFPDVTQPVTLQKRYEGKMPQNHLELVANLLMMEPAQRLSAKGALRSQCFKDLRGKDSERQEKMPQPQKVGGGTEHSGKNATSADGSLPPKAPKPAKPAAFDWEGIDIDTPPQTQATQATPHFDKAPMKDMLPRSELPPTMPPVKQPQAGFGLPSIGGAPTAAAVEDLGAAPKKSKLPKDNFVGSKNDFRTSQEGFGAKHKDNVGSKKDFRVSQESFGAKRKLVGDGLGGKRDFRMSQESFGAKRMSQESFGAKRELPAPLEETAMTYGDEETFEDFLRATPDEPFNPAPVQGQGAVPYRLPWEDAPWEDSAPPEDQGTAEYTRVPTPIFGGGGPQHGGFLVDPRSSGGVAAGTAAKNSKTPLASVARWQTLGVTKSRWSGA